MFWKLMVLLTQSVLYLVVIENKAQAIYTICLFLFTVIIEQTTLHYVFASLVPRRLPDFISQHLGVAWGRGYVFALFQVCISIARLSPTTAMWSCRILVRVMLVLCSVQLTGLPAVQIDQTELKEVQAVDDLLCVLPTKVFYHSCWEHTKRRFIFTQKE